jgi:malate permease and related proteins
MTTLLPAVLPVGLIILIGCIAGRTLPLQPQTLSQLILFVLSPALVIDSLYRTTLSIENSAKLFLAYGLTSLVIYCLVEGINRLTKVSKSDAKALMATSLFSNNGNMGLPVAAFALGAAGLERAIVCLIASSILLFCVGPALLQGKGVVYGLKLTLKLPLIWSITIGFGLRFFAIKFPFSLDKGIQTLGESAIPIALVLLGMQLSDTYFQLGIKETFTVIMRLVVSPFIAYTIGSFLNLELLSLQVLVLQCAMPTAVNSLVLVTEFGGDRGLVARSILFSTISSFVSLPVILWLFANN